jgi:glycosyltransferase involved in cell wall biosynthesis
MRQPIRAPLHGLRVADPERNGTMRIAYVTETYPPEINGVALTVRRSVEFLRERHAVDLIRPRQPGERAGDTPVSEVSGSGRVEDPLLPQRMWLSGGRAIPMYPDLRFGYAWPKSLERRFRAGGTHLVHVATQGPLGWAAVVAARRLGLPVTSDFRTNFHLYSRYYALGWAAPAIGAYLRRFHNRTRLSFVPTRQTRDELTAAGFERLAVVGRGVDLDRFNPGRRDDRLRAGWGAAGGPVLLCVGRLAAEKNVALALRAFRRARQFTPGARMVVVGDGPSRRELEAAYPDVLFVGMQTGDALAAHYASADLFIFPSLSETFGNVTLEALACGVPVVAFNVAAAAELVTDRINGRVVEPGDDEAFIAAACLLASLHRELAPMRIEARRAATGADWPTVLAGFERHLLEASGLHGQAGTPTACIA